MTIANKITEYIVTALKLFVSQTLLETGLIILLLYVGIPFFEMNVGNEHFYEIVVGVLGYYSLLKLIYFSLIYIISFTALSYLLKVKTKIGFSYLNGVLSVLYVLLFIINGKKIIWILNPFIAIVIASVSIVIYFKTKSNTASL